MKRALRHANKTLYLYQFKYNNPHKPRTSALFPLFGMKIYDFSLEYVNKLTQKSKIEKYKEEEYKIICHLSCLGNINALKLKLANIRREMIIDTLSIFSKPGFVYSITLSPANYFASEEILRKQLLVALMSQGNFVMNTEAFNALPQKNQSEITKLLNDFSSAPHKSEAESSSELYIENLRKLINEDIYNNLLIWKSVTRAFENQPFQIFNESYLGLRVAVLYLLECHEKRDEFGRKIKKINDVSEKIFDFLKFYEENIKDQKKLRYTITRFLKIIGVDDLHDLKTLTKISKSWDLAKFKVILELIEDTYDKYYTT